MKIAAIIVTFNREQKLPTSIRSLFQGKKKPDEVIIVNNASTDNTSSILEELQKEFSCITVVNTKENIGGAGGVSIGLKTAYDLLATHFWIMDDDGLANELSLSNLVRGFNLLNEKHKVGFVCSRVDWIDGQICEMNQPETAWNWMRVYSQEEPYIQVNASSFVSCFFSRTVLEEHGLPLRKFFIWFDDSEFTHRLSRHYPCFAILDSVVVHDTPSNQGVNFSFINDQNVWKYSYGAANESWYRFKIESPFHWILFFVQQNVRMYRGKVSLKNKLKINSKFFRGIATSHRIEAVQSFNIDDYIE